MYQTGYLRYIFGYWNVSHISASSTLLLLSWSKTTIMQMHVLCVCAMLTTVCCVLSECLLLCRGIDVVRNKIKMFAHQKVTLPKGRHKIIILDEADRYGCSVTCIGYGQS